MAVCPSTTLFDHANPNHRALASWRAAGPHGWQTTARRHAARVGEAKVWRSDDSVIRFWKEGERVRQRTYHHVLHTNR